MTTYRIIANPTAGRGKARSITAQIVELFRQRSIPFQLDMTRQPGDAERSATTGRGSDETLIGIGGDGTLYEIIQGAAASGKTVAVIPAGSGNDLAKALKMPKRLGEVVDVIVRGSTLRMDLGRINGRYFHNVVGVGFDAAVNHVSHGVNLFPGGFLNYLWAVALTLGKYEPRRMKVVLNGRTVERKLFLVTIGNGPVCGGGFKLTPDAKIDDGLLDVTMLPPLSLPALLRHMPKAFTGAVGSIPGAELARTTALTIESDTPLPVHVDGDRLPGDTRSLRIEMLPAALTIIGNF